MVGIDNSTERGIIHFLALKNTMYSRLGSAQNDWVEAKVKEGFEPSKAVNSVLLKESGVPAMPEQDQVIRMAQAELAGKKAAVDFMMGAEKGERPVFSYQAKLVVPKKYRVLIARTLLDRQPRDTETASIRHKPEFMEKSMEGYLASSQSRVRSPTWYWELGQGAPIIKTSQDGDDSRYTLDYRSREWLRSLPAGMRGTDLPSWTTRMATRIREGKPLDSRSLMTFREVHHTILDEESLIVVGHNRFMVGGSFSPHYQQAALSAYEVDNPFQNSNARFLAAIDGPIIV